MALTNYNCRPPTLASPLQMFAIPGGTTNNAPISVIFPGDYAVAFFVAESGVDPTSVVMNGGWGAAFTKLSSSTGMSVWYYYNNTTNTYIGGLGGGAVATWAAGTASIALGCDITDVLAGSIFFSGPVTAAARARDTDILTGSISNANPLMTLSFAGAIRSAAGVTGITLRPVHATPGGILAQEALKGQNGAAKGIGAFAASSSGEDVHSSVTNTVLALQFSDSSGAVNAAGFTLGFRGVPVSLDDYTYLFEGGPLLNSGNAAPFYDVDSVTGLSGMDVTNSSDAIDGTDGSYVSGKFVSGKTIVVEGTIFSTGPGFDETLLDSLKAVLQPNNINSTRFYYKQVNIAPRFIDTIPVSLQADIDRNRALSQCPFQIQALTQDSNSQSLISTPYDTSASFTLATNGNTDSFPIVFFNIYPADIIVGNFFKFVNMTYDALRRPTSDIAAGKGVTVNVAAATRGIYKLDFKNRTLWFLTPTGYVDVSNLITERNWWTIVPFTPNSFGVSLGTGGMTELPIIYIPDYYR